MKNWLMTYSNYASVESEIEYNYKMVLVMHPILGNIMKFVDD